MTKFPVWSVFARPFQPARTGSLLTTDHSLTKCDRKCDIMIRKDIKVSPHRPGERVKRGTMRKKIIVVNAGPRTGWNTDTLLAEAARGAGSAGAEVEVK